MCVCVQLYEASQKKCEHNLDAALQYYRERVLSSYRPALHRYFSDAFSDPTEVHCATVQQWL